MGKADPGVSGRDYDAKQVLDPLVYPIRFGATGHMMVVDFLKQGVAEYLVKPVEKEKLLETVEKAVTQRTRFAGEGGI